MRRFAKRYLKADYGYFGTADAFRQKYGVDTSRIVVGFDQSINYPERAVNEAFCKILEEVDAELQAEDFKEMLGAI